MARSLTLQEQSDQRKRRAHKGTDCVSVRLEGEHVHYACTTCLPRVMSDLWMGDDTKWVSVWGVPKWLISANQKIQCVYADFT